VNLTLETYNAFCAGLPHTCHVVQWGGAHVWKVDTKVFAVAGWSDSADQLAVSFKVTPLSFRLMKDQPGLRPAPYLAARSMTWVQRTGPETLDDAELLAYLAQSHRLVAQGLPKRRQIELGLTVTAARKTTNNPVGSVR